MGNIAFNNSCYHDLPANSYMCSCHCHNVISVDPKNSCCRCKCFITSKFKIIAENKNVG